MAALISPIVTVLLENEGADDYTEYTVQTGNQDYVRWDLERHKRDWPTEDKARILFLTTMAWAALIRSKEITLKLEVFLDRCAQVRNVDKAGAESDEAVTVDPTQTDPAPA